MPLIDGVLGDVMELTEGVLPLETVFFKTLAASKPFIAGNAPAVTAVVVKLPKPLADEGMLESVCEATSHREGSDCANVENWIEQKKVTQHMLEIGFINNPLK